MDKQPYLEHQITVNWNKNIRKFWKPTDSAQLHKFFCFNLEKHNENSKVDIKNDILIIRTHEEISKIFMSYLDKGMRFIIDCLWEDNSPLFHQLRNYNNNGIGIISSTKQSIKNWPANKLFFVPMSFWYIEFYKNLETAKPNINFLYPKPYEFLMPLRKAKPERLLFLNLIEDQLHKAIYSKMWENRFLPILNNDTRDHDRYYNPNWYNLTYYSMVVETIQRQPIFITEKTYKPIMYGHPFMIFGSKGILKILQENNFHTFPELFDESYDNESDIYTRAEMIAHQIKNFNLLNFNDKKDDISRKCYENYHRFYNKDLVIDGIIKDIKIPLDNFIFS